jgi:hypothetical protein
MVIFLRAVAYRLERGGVRLRTALRVSENDTSADPMAIAPTPSGPLVVSLASVCWLVETSILAAVREEEQLIVVILVVSEPVFTGT